MQTLIPELAPNCHTITKPPSGTYKYLYRPARGTRAGIWLPYNYKPLWHLRTPLRARQRNTELAPHCRTLTNTEPLTPPILSANRPLRDPSHPLQASSILYTPLRTSYLYNIVDKQANRRRLKEVTPGSWPYDSLTVRK
jgi:hypothetical protein